jgi:hypothetical protein
MSVTGRSVPFRFVLIRGAAEVHPQAAQGLVYRAQGQDEAIWTMSLAAEAASRETCARLLALLVVDQVRQVLPPARKRSKRVMGLLADSGSLMDAQGRPLAVGIQAEVGRLGADLLDCETYFVERLRRFFREDGLPAGFEPVPESHPIYDPAVEQVLAPLPPLLLAQSLEMPRV